MGQFRQLLGYLNFSQKYPLLKEEKHRDEFVRFAQLNDTMIKRI